MKSRNAIPIMAALFVVSLAFAQPPDTLWTHTYGGIGDEQGSCVQQTQDGGFIIVGTTTSYGAGQEDVYLIKTDDSGNELWHQTYGGMDADIGTWVQQTLDGGFIITGYSGFAVVNLIKTDEDGNEVWWRTYSSNDWTIGMCVDQTTDGGYFITGYTGSMSPPFGSDVYLIKTDANGDTLWTRTYGVDNQDNGLSGQQTSDGGYIITGGTGPGSFTESDVYLVKTDANGDSIWTRTYSENGSDAGWSVQQTSDEGYIVAGTTFYPNPQDVYLIKTDADGNTQWTRTLGESDVMEVGKSIQQTSDGGYIIGGDFNSDPVGMNFDAYLLATDAYGNALWDCTFGGIDIEFGNCVRQTIDEGYILAGQTFSYGAGSSDLYLVRLESAVPPELSITLTPHNPPIVIPASGGSSMT